MAAIAFALCLLVHALLLLLGPQYPTTDGGSHLYNAQLLLQADQHRDLLEWNSWFLPQWIAPLFLAAKVQLFGLDFGYRIHLLLVSWAVTAAIWFCAPKENRILAAAGSLLISLGYPFSMGFFSYCLGMGGIAISALLCWRWRETPWTWRQTAALSAVLLLLYFTHLVPFGFACVLVLAIPGSRKRKLSAIIPALLLTAAYLRYAQQIRYILPSGAQPISNWWASAILYPFLPLSSEPGYRLLQATTAGWFGLLLVFAVWRKWWFRIRPDLRDWAVVGAVLLMAGAPLLPDGGFGGSVLQSRVAHLGPLVLLIWAAVADWTERQRKNLTLLACLLCGAMYLNRWALASWLEPVQQEILQANHWIPRGAKVLAIDVSPLGFDHRDRERSLWIRPLAHFDGILAARGGWFNLYNYEAASGVFPQRFRADRNPDRALFNGHAPPDPPLFHLDAYQKEFGQPVEFVVLINPEGGNWQHLHLQEVARQLASYRVVGGNRMVRVWQVAR